MPYVFSPNEEARIIQEEWKRRRILRLQQVRDQSKVNAKKIREAVKNEYNRQIQIVSKKLQKKNEDERQEEIRKLEEELARQIKGVGDAHRAAKLEEANYVNREEIMEKNRFAALKRHQEALRRLKEEQDNKWIEENQHQLARMAALEKEKDRAAKIAALPPPPVDPVDALQPVKVRPVRFTDLNAFSSTFYHMPGPGVVEKAEPSQQGDAISAANEEEERMTQLKEEKTRDEHGRIEKAQLRHKHALKKERLKQDYDNMLHDLSDLQREDRHRRQQVVAKIPKQIFLPPHRRLEEKQDQQQELERAFQDMYLAATDYVGNISLVLEPHAPPRLPTPDASLDLTTEVEDEATEETETETTDQTKSSKTESISTDSKPPSVLSDITNQGQGVRSFRRINASDSAIRKLTDRIKAQREASLKRSVDSDLDMSSVSRTADENSEQTKTEVSSKTGSGSTLTQYTISDSGKERERNDVAHSDGGTLSTGEITSSNGSDSVATSGITGSARSGSDRAESSTLETGTISSYSSQEQFRSNSRPNAESATLLHPLEEANKVRRSTTLAWGPNDHIQISGDECSLSAAKDKMKEEREDEIQKTRVCIKELRDTMGQLQAKRKEPQIGEYTSSRPLAVPDNEHFAAFPETQLTVPVTHEDVSRPIRGIDDRIETIRAVTDRPNYSEYHNINDYQDRSSIRGLAQPTSVLNTVPSSGGVAPPSVYRNINAVNYPTQMLYKPNQPYTFTESNLMETIPHTGSYPASYTAVTSSHIAPYTAAYTPAYAAPYTSSAMRPPVYSSRLNAVSANAHPPSVIPSSYIDPTIYRNVADTSLSGGNDMQEKIWLYQERAAQRSNLDRGEALEQARLDLRKRAEEMFRESAASLNYSLARGGTGELVTEPIPGARRPLTAQYTDSEMGSKLTQTKQTPINLESQPTREQTDADRRLRDLGYFRDLSGSGLNTLSDLGSYLERRSRDQSNFEKSPMEREVNDPLSVMYTPEVDPQRLEFKSVEPPLKFPIVREKLPVDAETSQRDVSHSSLPEEIDSASQSSFRPEERFAVFHRGQAPEEIDGLSRGSLPLKQGDSLSNVDKEENVGFTPYGEGIIIAAETEGQQIDVNTSQPSMLSQYALSSYSPLDAIHADVISRKTPSPTFGEREQKRSDWLRDTRDIVANRSQFSDLTQHALSSNSPLLAADVEIEDRTTPSPRPEEREPERQSTRNVVANRSQLSELSQYALSSQSSQHATDTERMSPIPDDRQDGVPTWAETQDPGNMVTNLSHPSLLSQYPLSSYSSQPDTDIYGTERFLQSAPDDGRQNNSSWSDRQDTRNDANNHSHQSELTQHALSSYSLQQDTDNVGRKSLATPDDRARVSTWPDLQDTGNSSGNLADLDSPDDIIGLRHTTNTALTSRPNLLPTQATYDEFRARQTRLLNKTPDIMEPSPEFQRSRDEQAHSIYADKTVHSLPSGPAEYVPTTTNKKYTDYEGIATSGNDHLGRIYRYPSPSDVYDRFKPPDLSHSRHEALTSTPTDKLQQPATWSQLLRQVNPVRVAASSARQNTFPQDEGGISDEPDLTLVSVGSYRSPLKGRDSTLTNVTAVTEDAASSLLSFERHEQSASSASNTTLTHLVGDVTSGHPQDMSATHAQSLLHSGDVGSTQPVVTRGNDEAKLVTESFKQGQREPLGGPFWLEYPTVAEALTEGGRTVGMETVLPETRPSATRESTSSSSTEQLTAVQFQHVTGDESTDSCRGLSLQEAFRKKKPNVLKQSAKRQEEAKQKAKLQTQQAHLGATLASWKRSRALNPPDQPTGVQSKEKTALSSKTSEDRKVDETEMKKRTERLYNLLDEVREQKKEQDRKEQYAKNREKAKEYQKKLDKRVKQKTQAKKRS